MDAVNEYESLQAQRDELLKFAEEVSKDYEDAADWKDAYGRLHDVARKLIAKCREGEKK